MKVKEMHKGVELGFTRYAPCYACNENAET
jgi:hypothetical protein